TDIEAAARQFALSGDDRAAGDLDRTRDAFDREAASVRVAVADDPTAVDLVDQTTRALDRWSRDALEPMIAQRRELNKRAAPVDLALLRGFEDKRAAFFGRPTEVALAEHLERSVQSTSGQLRDQRARGDIVVLAGTVAMMICGVAAALL